MNITKKLPEGLTLFHFKTLDSTNKTAVEMASSNASSGTIVGPTVKRMVKGEIIGHGFQSLGTYILLLF